MTDYYNGFDAGPDGDTLTAANSADSGDAFNAIQIGTSSSMVYDSTHSADGGLSCKISGGNATSTYASKNFAVATSKGTLRLLLYLLANPAANLPIGGFYSGSTVRVRHFITSAGKITINSPNGGSVTSAASIPLNNWFVVELSATMAAGSGGSSTCKLYNNKDDTAPAETFGQTGVNYGGTADRTRIGVSTASSGVIPTFWIDAAAWNDTGVAIGALSKTPTGLFFFMS